MYRLSDKALEEIKRLLKIDDVKHLSLLEATIEDFLRLKV